MAITHLRAGKDTVGLLAGPPPPDAENGARMHEGQRRRRLLEGLWKVDLLDALRKEFEPRKRRLMGMPDTTKNLFRSLITQLAVLYDRTPVVRHRRARAVVEMNRITTDAGLWQIAVTHQQLTLALRESSYRFDVVTDDEGSRLLVRTVPADLTIAEAWEDDPDRPHTVYEYRIRELTPGGERGWTRDCISIKDPDRPVFRIETADGKEDITSKFLAGGALVGDSYPYRKEDGTPILPFVLYHATRTGRLWDPWRGVEVVDGTLTIAGLWTQWRHLVRDASWPQRYAINAVVDGLEANEVGDLSLTSDPSTVVNFRPKIPGTTATVGQFDPGGDPKALGEAIRDYSGDLAADFDLSPGEIKATHDRRSGYAIEVTREGQRSAQRRVEPQFRRGDREALSVIAILWNRATGAGLPEDGWDIEYLGLPLSNEERRFLMEDHKMRAELGITSKPELLAALEGITADQARARLVEFEIDNARFAPGRPQGPQAAPPPTDTPNPAPNRPQGPPGALNEPETEEG
jgi:hypothetical protein